MGGWFINDGEQFECADRGTRATKVWRKSKERSNVAATYGIMFMLPAAKQVWGLTWWGLDWGRATCAGGRQWRAAFAVIYIYGRGRKDIADGNWVKRRGAQKTAGGWAPSMTWWGHIHLAGGFLDVALRAVARARGRRGAIYSFYIFWSMTWHASSTSTGGGRGRRRKKTEKGEGDHLEVDGTWIDGWIDKRVTKRGDRGEGGSQLGEG